MQSYYLIDMKYQLTALTKICVVFDNNYLFVKLNISLLTL